jgi:hypothetical protein
MLTWLCNLLEGVLGNHNENNDGSCKISYEETEGEQDLKERGVSGERIASSK